MKGLLAVLSVISCVAAESPAPYAPSGWRPSGPAFELPTGQNPNYLAPVDPRVPASVPDAEDDVTVQGLPPRQEQQPIFHPSPISGQQYVGPNFNSDIRNLDQSLQQTQIQQQKAREFARQKQENESNRLPSSNVPRQFVPRTTVNPTRPSFTPRPDFRTTPFPSTTESDLNEGETDDVIPPAVAEKQKVTVEVSRQNIQEYPPELFLNPLAQLRLEPVQFGQIKSPFFGPEPAQKQVQGFDAQTHFAALPSILAQQQLAQQRAMIQEQQFPQNQAYVIRGQTSGAGFRIQSPQQLQPIINGQYAPLIQPVAPNQGQNVVLQPLGINQVQPNAFAQPKQPEEDDDERDNSQTEGQSQDRFQPQPQVSYQQQPQLIYQGQPQQYQPEAEAVYPQQVYQQQPQVAYQPQPQLVYQSAEGFQQPQPQAAYQPQPQMVYQPQTQVAYQPQAEAVFPQPQGFQPQAAYQPQSDQPQLVYQQFPQPQGQNLAQGQLINFPGQALDQYYQQRLAEAQIQQNQGQDALQSGFNVNQQGNSVENEEKDENEDANEDGGSTATAVATAFGTRTQPRVYTRYGAPAPRPQTATTEPAVQDSTTEDGPAIAEATAVANGGRRKNAKLRNRRIRPVFTLDRSGHLVLAQDQ